MQRITWLESTTKIDNQIDIKDESNASDFDRSMSAGVEKSFEENKSKSNKQVVVAPD